MSVFYQRLECKYAADEPISNTYANNCAASTITTLKDQGISGIKRESPYTFSAGEGTSSEWGSYNGTLFYDEEHITDEFVQQKPPVLEIKKDVDETPLNKEIEFIAVGDPVIETFKEEEEDEVFSHKEMAIKMETDAYVKEVPPLVLEVKEEFNERFIPEDVDLTEEMEIKSEDEDEPRDKFCTNDHCEELAEKSNLTNQQPSRSKFRQRFFLCNACEYKTTHKSNFKRHQSVHLKERLEETLTHQLIYLGEKPLACIECDYKCAQKSDLIKHILCHSDEKPFSCSECDYKGKQEAHLKKHMASHSEDKPFACNLCNYKTKRRTHLKNHQLAIHLGKSLSHSRDRPYPCSQCGYKALYKSLLKQHQLIHSEEKPFACNECDYKCIGQAALRKHQVIHSGEKPFTCDECDFKCTRKSNLKRHLLIHLGEKPFSCKKCGYKCREKARLQKHLLTHVKTEVL